ncbi:aldehyde dehydrogenase family protein [Amycolatopsis sp. Poz14]|uniref:aldehyde dehydrogenase family protein n=1 Tax=Amycolatopsis sp. Poz14 TaxID=1447705 RepID=UPI001EE94536|nr:aldehyde dehydrogenase family protein [Amycolatopsis sp. Poz14]MCG3754063.1 aldehyde dehydrogenase family protein [Amycolatopsis sp. Poz14]
MVSETAQRPEPRQFIGGQWRTGAGTEAIDVFDPATGARLGEVAAASESDVDDAVRAAADAFGSWSALSLSRRVAYISRFRALVQRDAEALAETVSLDQGKTLDEARGEVTRLVDAIDCAAAAPMIFQSGSGNIAAGLDARRVRIPLGVCAAVTPSNFPVMNPGQFAAWALVCGNTLVLKVSEQDPYASTHLIKILEEAELPPGVLNLVHGRADAVKRLIASPEVAAVSCITSTPTARSIYAAAAAQGKRVQANGGAKNPIVVAEDADLERAATGIVSSVFGMAGQRCLADTRVIAAESVYDTLVDLVAARASKLVVGSGLDPRTTMGPVVSAQSKERLEAAVDAAVSGGAKAVLDGRGVRPSSGGPDGYFIGPSVLVDVEPGSDLDRNETFGPIVNIHRAASFDDAVALANDTEFGNAATVYTRSGSTAREFEQRSTAGNVGINTFPAPPMNFTMGGSGSSFYGDLHICGDGPLDFYTDHKLVLSRW